MSQDGYKINRSGARRPRTYQKKSTASKSPPENRRELDATGRLRPTKYKRSNKSTPLSSAPLNDVSSAPLNDVSSAPLNVSSAPLNDVSSAPLNDVTSAPLNDVTSAPLNDVTSAALNDVSSAPLNDVSSAPLNDVSSAPLNDVSSAPLNDVSSAPLNDVSSAPTEASDMRRKISQLLEDFQPTNVHDTFADCLSGEDGEDDEPDAPPVDDETDDNTPIYKGHWMTVSVSVMLIMLFSMAHAVTGAQLADLLTLVGLHCLSVPDALRSVYRLRKHFSTLDSPLTKHYYCSFCHSHVNPTDVHCPNTFCSKDLNSYRAKAYFITIPIVHQLRALFQQDNFITGIGHRFRRQQDEDRISDIYDGNIYRQFVKDGLLSDDQPFNLSFTLNTDGIPLFKSSKMALWPVYLMVNELPPHMRKQKSNMVFYGIWFGASKPTFPTFCGPLHSQLQKLETDGVSLAVNGNDVHINCFLLSFSADLPARAAFLNMNQFNGAYSCIRCCQKGESWRSEKGGTVHIFPFQVDNPSGPERTSAECLRQAYVASESGSPQIGLKGPSFLMVLSSFDFVRSVSFDYMHGVLLGVTKLLMSLWFLPTHSGSCFSLVPLLSWIDSNLCQIRPPGNVSRRPRSIADHFKFWKASEFRSWLFHYSLPLLRGVMGYSYYYHYACFVEAISILSGDNITRSSVQQADQLLKYFVFMFAPLYGDRYVTLNVHSLLHLSQAVEDLGPLWVQSCFAFENVNGSIVGMFHGTQHVDLQIMSAVNMMQLMPSIMAQLPPDSPAIGFVSKLRKLSKLSSVSQQDGVRFLGAPFRDEISMIELNRKLIEKVNITGTEHVLKACHTHDITRLVYTSTYNVVFGGEEIRDGDESLPYLAEDRFTDYYSYTKMLSEKKVLGANGSKTANQKTLNTCALRLAGVYGPGEQRHIPRIVSYLEQGLVVVTYGLKESLVDFLHVDNLVQAHSLAGQALCLDRGYIAAGQAYFISDNKPINNFEFFRPLFEGLGYPFPKVNLPLSLVFYMAFLTEIFHSIVGRIYNFQPLLTRTEVYKTGVTHTFSISKAHSELGYTPSVQNDLSEVLKYYQRTGHVRHKPRRSSFWYWVENIIIGIIFFSILMSFLPGVVGSL